MENTLWDRLKRSWNAFRYDDSTRTSYYDEGRASYYRPDMPKTTRGNERSIVTSVCNRIALDAASVDIKHVRLDTDGRFKEEMASTLNNCLTLEANLDQTSRYFMQDLVLTILDVGSAAIVPVSTSVNPRFNSTYDIFSMRVGTITKWMPSMVTVRLYDELEGEFKDLTLNKSDVAIVSNPFYAVMNEPSSVMQRLIRKLNILDAIDEQSGSGKLDLIIQLPFLVKGERKKQEAEARRMEIERQLSGTKYGIAYIDGTEHITQLNRAVENNLMGQIDFLTKQLYSELGVTQEILNGTAKDEEMTKYQSRVIEPILSYITMEMTRKFLTKTARTQGQAIKFFLDPFKMISASNIAEMADKMTRNEIMSSNEFRRILGMKPSDDPAAEELRNKNLNQATGDGSDIDQEAVSELVELNKLDNELNALDVELDRDDEELEQFDNTENLTHYASKYYDPEYAHRYYEEHKQLKGRRSTSGLNEEGREHAAYAKSNIYAERDKKIDESLSRRDSSIERSNANRDRELDNLKEEKESTIQMHTAQMNKQIESIRARLESMDSASKKANRDQIKSQIENLRRANTVEKAKVLSKFGIDTNQIRTMAKSEVSKARTDHTSEKKEIKDWADDQYEKELEQIKNNPNLQQQKKTKGESSSKSVRLKPFGT